MNVRILVFDGEQYDGDWPTDGYDTSLAAAIAWFQGKMQEIPAEFMASAKCHIDSASSYETHYGHIEIWYERPETEEEAARRIADQRAKADRARDDELAMLKALQAKYPYRG